MLGAGKKSKGQRRARTSWNLGLTLSIQAVMHPQLHLYTHQRRIGSVCSQRYQTRRNFVDWFFELANSATEQLHGIKVRDQLLMYVLPVGVGRRQGSVRRAAVRVVPAVRGGMEKWRVLQDGFAVSVGTDFRSELQRDVADETIPGVAVEVSALGVPDKLSEVSSGEGEEWSVWSHKVYY